MASKPLQARLGASDTNQLVLVTASQAARSPSPGPYRGLPMLGAVESRTSNSCNAQATILQLPEELLQQCIQAVHSLDTTLSHDPLYQNKYYGERDADDLPSEDDEEQCSDDPPRVIVRRRIRYAATHAASLTCKRFYAIAVPMLYTRPRFDTHYYEKDRESQCNKFYNTLEQNPALRPFVKHLTLQYKDFCHEFVQKCLKFPNLESLVLDSPWDEDKDGNEEDQAGGPLPEDEGTASLTELRLRSARLRPQDVKRFLEWPRQLKIFALDDVTFDGYDWEYTEPSPEYRWSHALLTDTLSHQRHNLQILQLGWMGYTQDQNQFDVSLFPKLHTLQLCIAYEEPDAVACRNWLTPSLRTLVLDLAVNDSQCGKLSGFGPRESAHTLRVTRLVSAAKKQRPRSIGLEKIGFVAQHTGDAIWRGNEEWSCDHEGRTDKALILKTLSNIKAQGFSGFWIGASGTRHTVQMIQEACSVCADAIHEP